MDSNGILRGSYWDFNRIHQWSNEKTLVDGLKNWDLYYLILTTLLGIVMTHKRETVCNQLLFHQMGGTLRKHHEVSYLGALVRSSTKGTDLGPGGAQL